MARVKSAMCQVIELAVFPASSIRRFGPKLSSAHRKWCHKPTGKWRTWDSWIEELMALDRKHYLCHCYHDNAFFVNRVLTWLCSVKCASMFSMSPPFFTQFGIHWPSLPSHVSFLVGCMDYRFLSNTTDRCWLCLLNFLSALLWLPLVLYGEIVLLEIQTPMH